MRDAAGSADFQNIDKADNVAVYIDVRILQRVAHADLSGQVNHPVELFRPQTGWPCPTFRPRQA